MGISLTISVIVPLITAYFIFRGERIPFRVFAVGAGIWILFTQILEKMLHMFVINKTGIAQSPVLFAIYGSLAAGLFEEIGRYIAYSRYIPKARAWKDGLAYGLGHGGAESLFIGITGNLQLIALSVLMNSGSFGKVTSALPKDAAKAVADLLTGPWHVFLLGGVERILALAIQIMLSVIVLYGIRKRKLVYVGVAILLHAAFDIPAALYQTHILNLVLTELLLALMTIPAVWFIIQSRRLFDHT